MKTAAVVLFSCLAVAYGQTTYCRNGVIPCAPNAACAGGAPSGDCVCSSTFIGDGRVRCSAAATRCVCVARSDPHLTLFDPSPVPDRMTENLPCSMKLAPSGSIISSSPFCIITDVFAHPDVRTVTGPSPTVFRTFVKSLAVTALIGTSLLSGLLDSTGFTPNSPDVTQSTAGGYQLAAFSPAQCAGFTIGFNTTYGAAFIDTTRTPGSPYPAGAGAGLCGNCDGTTETPGTTSGDQLAYALRFIAPTASQVGPYANTCGAIQTVVGTCSAANRVLAGKICVQYLEGLGNCMKTGGSTAAAIFTAFQSCVTQACSTGGIAACTQVSNTAAGVIPACTPVSPCPPV